MNDPLRRFPGYVLRRTSTTIMAVVAARVAPLGLRPVEASLLVVIGARPGLSQSEVGRVLGIKRANMTPLVTSMEKRGLITRQKVDGRSRALLTTRRGEAVSERVLAAFEDAERQMVARIPARYRDHFLRGLYALWDGSEGA